jgi:cytochrome c oxidase subunit 4
MTARRLLIAWVGLIALLAIEVAVSLIPWTPASRPLLLIPAVLMVMVVAIEFMEITRAPRIARLFAGAGLLWLVILLALGCLDAMTRIEHLVGR